MLWLLCWSITSHRSKQPVIGNVQDDGSYSMSSRRVVKFVDSGASSCRQQSCGNDVEHNLVLILCAPSGFSIISTRSTGVLTVTPA